MASGACDGGRDYDVALGSLDRGLFSCYIYLCKGSSGADSFNPRIEEKEFFCLRGAWCGEKGGKALMKKRIFTCFSSRRQVGECVTAWQMRMFTSLYVYIHRQRVFTFD